MKIKKENKGKKSIFGTQQGIAMIVLAILYIFFYIKSTAFRSTTTLASIFDSSYYLSFLAIGVTFTIATGAFDMSIGAVMNTSALIAGFISIKMSTIQDNRRIFIDINILQWLSFSCQGSL